MHNVSFYDEDVASRESSVSYIPVSDSADSSKKGVASAPVSPCE